MSQYGDGTVQTAFHSSHDAVLQAWIACGAEHEQWLDEMGAEQRRLGRLIFRSFSGLSRREQVVGLEFLPDQPVPPGWMVTDKDYLAPAEGSAGDAARAWLDAHQPPVSPERRLEPFGLADHFELEDQVYWPGVEQLDNGLYVTWGIDTGWDGSGFFRKIPLSEYYAARERTLSDLVG